MLLLRIYQDRLIHSIKIGLACFLGFFLIRIVHFQTDQWLIITILVVMTAQLSVGSMMHKATMRFLGTFMGSLFAAFVLVSFKQTPEANMIAVAVAGMIFGYISTGKKNYNEIGTLGAVTVAVILIGQHPTLTTVWERTLEISAGILTAALVSQFILPIHAKKRLLFNQATVLRQLRDYYINTLMQDKMENAEVIYFEVDEKLAKALIDQRKLAVEASKEKLGKRFNVLRFGQSLWHEKEIFRSITFMYHACHKSIHLKKLFFETALFTEFHQSIDHLFATLANHIENNVPGLVVEFPPLDALKKSVKEATKNFSAEDQLSANGFLFCAEILVARLKGLTEMLR